MGRLILSMFVTLDGYVAGPDGDLSWFAEVEDEELDGQMAGMLGDADALLLGRSTYDMFTTYWPSVDTDAPGPEATIARYLNELPKLVATTRPASLDWGPAEALGGDELAAQVAQAKGNLERSLVLFGGASTARPLIDADVVDEYLIVVNPLLLGAGQRLFGDGGVQRRLALVDVRSFAASGAVRLRYERARS